MIKINADINAINPNIFNNGTKPAAAESKTGFNNAFEAVKQQVSKVDELQKQADESVVDLLTGKNNDITSVVSSVAKADMSFKLLVGVRNKLIEAYKQTMNMNI